MYKKTINYRTSKFTCDIAKYYYFLVDFPSKSKDGDKYYK